MSHRED